VFLIFCFCELSVSLISKPNTQAQCNITEQQSGSHSFLESFGICPAFGSGHPNETLYYFPTIRQLKNALDLSKERRSVGTQSIVFVYIYLPWCPFSLSGEPHIVRVASAFPTYPFYRFPTNLFCTECVSLNIRSLPALLYFRNGVAKVYRGKIASTTVLKFVEEATGIAIMNSAYLIFQITQP
jgi:hypothetical protein